MKAPRRLLQPEAQPDEQAEFIPLESRTVAIVPIGEVDSYHEIDGAILWVRPERGTTAEELAHAVERLREGGAVRVLGMPLEAVDAAVPAKLVERPTKASANVRTIVEGMLDEVTELRDEVREIVEQALSEAGL